MTKKSHYQTWNYLAKTWGKNVFPPASPCKDQLKIYEKIIKKITTKETNSRALILGSTPELRDLCLKYNLETTVCDINPDMIAAMSNLMKYRNHPKEKTVQVDWLKMNFPAGSYNLIMGDLSFNQILKKNDVERLFKKCARFLKSNGLLIIREATRLKIRPIIKNEDWVKYIEKYEQKKLNEVELYFFYKYQSDANHYPKSPSLVDWLPALDRLLELESQGKIGRAGKGFIRWVNKTTGTKPKPTLIFTGNDLEKILKKYFKLLPIKQCREYMYCKYMPLILAKPKN